MFAGRYSYPKGEGIEAIG